MTTRPCDKCGEEIGFVQTVGGKWIPVDPEAATALLAPGVTLVTDDGRVLRGSPATATVSAVGFVPHWATCPFADDFRKRKREAQ